MTFLEMARLLRLRARFDATATGAGGGSEPPSGFGAAFARLGGVAPGALPREAPLLAATIASPLGPLVAIADAEALHLLEFTDRRQLPAELARLPGGGVALGRTAVHDRLEAELDAYFAGRSAVFATPLSMGGTPFARRVWAALRAIPAGATRSYADLARAIDTPRAVRAVARANGANAIAILVPCHRVIGADGSLTGYGGGLWRKTRLLEIERAYR
jgi:AraC family transcriptional regulator of adaptative response/methylated-DNA-[protein]-cysteine methyltransferase